MESIYNQEAKCPVCGSTSAANKFKEHCSRCLSGVHSTNDKGNACGGILQPISVWVKPDNKWDILQMCSKCGEIVASPMSDEDNPDALSELVSRPMRYGGLDVERLPEEMRETWLSLLFTHGKEKPQEEK